MRQKVDRLLVGLVVFDLLLVVWIVGFPRLWTLAFNGTLPNDPERLLVRMGANWAAFFLFQLVAAFRWRRNPAWLFVVAGIRLSDIFTDVTHVLTCAHATWFAWVTLPLTSLLNLVIGLWLLRAGREFSLEKLRVGEA